MTGRHSNHLDGCLLDPVSIAASRTRRAGGGDGVVGGGGGCDAVEVAFDLGDAQIGR